MAGITKAHLTFINLVAKGEGQEQAYRTSIGSKNTTQSTASAQGSKLAKRYALEIEQERKRMRSAVEQANQSKEAQEALKSILSVAEVDAILCETITNPETEVGKLMAIDKYYKRFGHNAPIKSANTDPEGNAITPEFVILHKGVNPPTEN